MGPRDVSDEADTLHSTDTTRALHAVIVVGDDMRVVELPLGGELIFGRGRTCDVTIDHPTVSRQHAALRLDAPMAIRDLGSANGTTTRGQELVPDEWAPLHAGEAIHLGDVVLVIRRQTRRDRAPEEARLFERLEPTLARVAAGSISVLVLGETGAGKEICAETIHRLSPRSGRTFLRLHCAAMPETLLESELFGHERGAFTGAHAAKPGLLESAEGGTVFLDEIGELPPAVQVKLLRVLDTREVMRVGGLTPRTVDVRFIAATHRDLRAEVQAGRFREDLFYRLSAVTVRVPPLRERRDELPALAAELAAAAARDIGRGEAPRFSDDALAALARHEWPGNVRELRNVVARAVLLADGGTIGRRHLALDEPRPAAGATPGASLEHTVDATAPVPRRAYAETAPPPSPRGAFDAPLNDELRAIERARILDALERCGGNQTRAARMLGIARGTLIARLTSYGITRPRKP